MARILVIDDDKLMRNLLRCILQTQHHEVTEAEDGEAGLRALRNSVFDLVLCDIVMPNKEGLETIREMREYKHQLRIIAMSGGGVMDALPLARRLGADAVLYKPFGAPELHAAISSVYPLVSVKPAI